MRAAIYARFSDENQREESITAQLRFGRDYCTKKGYTITKEYADEAKTGRTDKRPSFQQMLRDAQSGLFDVLVVHKVNRFARNRLSSAINKHKLSKAGVRLEYIELQVEGKERVILESVLEGMAEYYSLDLAEEVMKGMNENAYKAMFNGGYAPLGYVIKDKHYVIHDREAEAIRLIFDLYLAEHGYSSISSELTRRGYSTRMGRPFGKNSLYSILRNPKYMGTYTFNKVVTRPDGTRNSHSVNENMIKVEQAIPSIVTAEIFGRVQAMMDKNKFKAGSYKAKERYLLSGLVECGHCGSALVGNSTSARGEKYKYYRCSSKERRVNLRCKNTSIFADDLESTVVDHTSKLLFSPGKANELVSLLTKAFEERSTKIDSERATLEKEKIEVARKMDNLYCAIENSDADEYDMQRLKLVKEKMTAINLRLNELLSNPKRSLTAEQVQSVIDSYKNGIKQKSPEIIRAFVTTFIDRIIISKEEITIRIKVDILGLVGAREGT